MTEDPIVRMQRMQRKSLLLRYLHVYVWCMDFYVAGRITGLIPQPPGPSAQVKA